LFDWLKKTELGVKRSREAWFGKIASLFDRGSVGEEIWGELEELLISADVGVGTTGKLVDGVKQRVKIDKMIDVSQIRAVLKEEMIDLLSIPDSHCHSEHSEESPQVILVVGVNGSGKTTSIAKLAYSFTSQGSRVILAAADTFRAAAIEQLKYWGKEAGAEVIAHRPGGDPGAVAFDAIQAAHNRHAQAVIIDTAGRLHTKFNLMEELKKIKRVAAKHDASAPHQVLLVMDATTGQNGLAQAKYFTQAIGITGIFLAKLDGTAKGGIVFAIRDELNIPIAYIGTGEKLPDIAPFDAEAFVNAIFS
jgi:fused signal recognition particle receptor